MLRTNRISISPNCYTAPYWRIYSISFLRVSTTTAAPSLTIPGETVVPMTCMCHRTSCAPMSSIGSPHSIQVIPVMHFAKAARSFNSRSVRLQKLRAMHVQSIPMCKCGGGVMTACLRFALFATCCREIPGDLTRMSYRDRERQ
jgi:hypothetical protein